MMGANVCKRFASYISLVAEMVQTLRFTTKILKKEKYVLAPNLKCTWNLWYAGTKCFFNVDNSRTLYYSSARLC